MMIRLLWILLLTSTAVAQKWAPVSPIFPKGPRATSLDGDDWWQKTSPVNADVNSVNATVIAAFRFTFAAQSGIRTIVDIGRVSSTNGRLVLAISNTLRERVSVTSDAGATVVDSGSTVLTANRWYVCVVSFTSAASVATYIDGVLSINKATSVTGYTSVDGLTVGAKTSTSSTILPFQGLIGNIRYVVGYAATQDDAIYITNAVKQNRDYSLQGATRLLLRWKQRGTDRSNNGNNLTETGAPQIVPVHY